MNKQIIDVDAILKEMRKTKEGVAMEILIDGEQPLIMNETSEYSLEELIDELEEQENITFNI